LKKNKQEKFARLKISSYICTLITKILLIKNKKRKIMRKLFLVLFAFFALTVTAQEQKTECSKTTTYVAVGLSMASFDKTFAENSFPSVEVGFTRNEVSYGVAFGRASLRGLGDSEDVFQNYFYELKVVPSVSLGYFNANLILGVGGYVNQGNRHFVEYGAGLSKTFGNVSYGLSYSNWDGVDYITPSVSYSF
jgi:hypothetical protein